MILIGQDIKIVIVMILDLMSTFQPLIARLLVLNAFDLLEGFDSMGFSWPFRLYFRLVKYLTSRGISFSDLRIGIKQNYSFWGFIRGTTYIVILSRLNFLRIKYILMHESMAASWPRRGIEQFSS